jgi:hypothetical protein
LTQDNADGLQPAFKLPLREAKMLEAVQPLLDLVPTNLRASRERAPLLLIVASFAHRAAKTYAAALRLAEAGYGEQALMLARSLFEDMVDMHWIQLDPAQAIERFNDHAVLSNRRTRTKGERYQALLGPDGLQLAQEELDAEQLARLESLQSSRSPSWTRLSLGKRVQAIQPLFKGAVEELTMFHELGNDLSNQYLHPSAQSIYNQIVRPADGPPRIDLRAGPSERLVSQGLLLCAWSFMHLVGVLYEMFDLDPEPLKEAAAVAMTPFSLDALQSPP